MFISPLKINILKKTEYMRLFLRYPYHYFCYARYIGYCTKVASRDLYQVEHIQRCGKYRLNLKWRYPSSPDIQCVASEHILECLVEGEWKILNNRNSEFTLRNHELIQEKLLELQTIISMVKTWLSTYFPFW